jgi:hypothetical protein
MTFAVSFEPSSALVLDSTPRHCFPSFAFPLLLPADDLANLSDGAFLFRHRGWVSLLSMPGVGLISGADAIEFRSISIDTK